MHVTITSAMSKPGWQRTRTTIKDIARAANVDPSTVTRALQDSPRVKPATRERIAGIATELGYVPNMAARTLVNRSSGLIGVVIPDMTNPFFAELGRGIEDEAAKHDLRILFHDTRGVESAEREGVQLFLELKVDGLLIPMARCPQDYYEAIKAVVPVVHVNREEAEHHVNCDTVAGSMFIMQHLFDLGHRRIGFVRGPAGPWREPKMFAYRRALDERGIDYDPDLIFTFDGTLESSRAIADEFLALEQRPTAVFAWNDVNAIALIHALKDRGVRVPEDVSIAGHDDIQLAGCIDPPLTTVAWPMYELGQQSVRYLYSLGHGNEPGEAEVPPPRLVVRESTGGPEQVPPATA
ncbi:MAG: LacI family DNA-binding transcriptional regulator [Pseudomonadota bacterium]